MMDVLCKLDGKKTGIFAAGVLFGTAGIKILSSKDAKKVYTHSPARMQPSSGHIPSPGAPQPYNGYIPFSHPCWIRS